jgi:hypothetical protein
MAGPFGCGGGGGGGSTVIPATGSLEIGFVDSPSKNFQAISLNVSVVRLNPSTNASVPDTDPNWVTVSAPPGAGPGELSVNLLDFQNNAMVFNTGSVTAQVYNQIEVVVDATLPGIVIPSCLSGSTPTQEGCITADASFSGSTNLRTSGTVNVTAGGLTPLIIDINPGTPKAPSSPGGNYTLSPTISVAPSTTYLVPLSGTVAGVTTTSVDSINAELTGTNAVVASAPVLSNGSYAIQLPAAANGTAYDLFVSGSTTYAVFPALTVQRGVSASKNFAVATLNAGTIAGTVIDARAQSAVVGATVNLLLPLSSANTCNTSLTGCVVVNTTTSDSAGNYSFSVPAPPLGTSYFVQGSSTGTNTTTQQVTAFSTTSTCTNSPNPANCSISLPNALLTATVMVDPLPSPRTNVVVTVMAEQTGTGNLVGLTQVAVLPNGSTKFSMEVPTGFNVDLIASAQDAYLGVGTQFSGHQLAVAANVAPAGTTSVATLTVSCLGHGTISGLANTPPADAGTHVRLFQPMGAALVQLMDTTIGLTLYPNQYSFCAPPNTYEVQRFEQAGPLASPSPVGAATMVVVGTPAPAPTPVSTPCPLCQSSATGLCPGNCSATDAGSL